MNVRTCMDKKMGYAIVHVSAIFATTVDVH